jgi:ABC-type nickel/cobalt efflux system permease component RcnA
VALWQPQTITFDMVSLWLVTCWSIWRLPMRETLKALAQSASGAHADHDHDHDHDHITPALSLRPRRESTAMRLFVHVLADA